MTENVAEEKCKSLRVVPLAEKVLAVLEKEKDVDVQVAALKCILLIPALQRAKKRS